MRVLCLLLAMFGVFVCSTDARACASGIPGCVIIPVADVFDGGVAYAGQVRGIVCFYGINTGSVAVSDADGGDHALVPMSDQSITCPVIRGRERAQAFALSRVGGSTATVSFQSSAASAGAWTIFCLQRGYRTTFPGTDKAVWVPVNNLRRRPELAIGSVTAELIQFTHVK